VAALAPHDAGILAEHATAIRARLTDCKRICGHGNWLPWLDREFGWTEQTALNFIRVHEVAKSKNFLDLNVPVSSLYLLAAPSTPNEARDAVLDHAAKGERLTHAQVREIIAAHGNAVVLRAAKVIRAEQGESRRAERIARILAIGGANSPLTRDRKYPVILADPPWKFEVYDAESGLDSAADAHYPTMELADICALPVADLATPIAVLFMWTTAPHLRESFEVLDSWGFDYVTHMVWVKGGRPPALGYRLRNQHELLIIGRRGDMPTPLPANRPPSVINAARREHSRKPDEVYGLIERMYSELPKIELFARGTSRPGWDTWGNEVATEAAE
jgi:N6-adenosine-specific RNA methylase IME4